MVRFTARLHFEYSSTRTTIAILAACLINFPLFWPVSLVGMTVLVGF